MSSQYGRFMTPDPMGGQLANPQSLNRYAYVTNNPLNMIDPTGMSGENGDPFHGCEEVGFCDAIQEGDWGFGPGYNGPTTTANMNFDGGYCGASSSGCGGFGGNAPGVDYSNSPDLGPFSIEFAGTFCLDKCYSIVADFDTWGGYTNWRTDIGAKAYELAYKDTMYNKLIGILGVTKATRLRMHGGNFNIGVTKEEGDAFLRSDPTCKSGAFGIRCADNNLHLTLQKDGTYRVHMDSGFLYDPTGLGAILHGGIDILCGYTLCSGGVPH